MPIYEFKCKNCGNTFEQLCFASDDQDHMPCPSCGEEKTVMIKTTCPALHAGKKKVKDCCPLFHLAHQVPVRDLEALRHPRPVLLPGDFPEQANIYSRELYRTKLRGFTQQTPKQSTPSVDIK